MSGILTHLTITNAILAVAGVMLGAGLLYLLYRLLAVVGRAAVAGARSLGRGVRRFSLIHLRRYSVLIVGTGGMIVAAFGTVRALHEMGQPLPLALATSGAIEGGAIYFAADLYIRSREGRPALRPRLASWGYALASAWANASHPPLPGTSAQGSLIFGLVPLLGLYLIEYQAHTDRAHTSREVTAWPLRVADAAWRRAWTAVATALGVDVNASDTDTERELASRRAARATYRLRVAMQTETSERKIRRLTRAVQVTWERAGVAADPRQAMRLSAMMRELVHGSDFAVGDWSDVTASASRVYGGMLLAGPDGLLDLSGHSAGIRDIGQKDIGPAAIGPAGADRSSPDPDAPTGHEESGTEPDMRSGLRLVRDASQDTTSTHTPVSASPGGRDVSPGVGHDPDTDPDTETDTEAAALAILAADPDIKGAELGRRLGVTERHGSRLKKTLSRSIHTEATGE